MSFGWLGNCQAVCVCGSPFSGADRWMNGWKRDDERAPDSNSGIYISGTCALDTTVLAFLLL